VDVAGRISFAPEDSGVSTTKLGFTIAPFNAPFVGTLFVRSSICNHGTVRHTNAEHAAADGTAYYQITGSSPSRTLLVSWYSSFLLGFALSCQ
jgi:hypothetical protein